MESIKISIIIPVYNAELYLSESLNSVANQSYRNWELIAINDGSTDKSLDILNQEHKKDSRIKIISISNSGVSHARNVGLSAANGDYILFLDADDLLMPKSLQTLLGARKRSNPTIKLSDLFKQSMNLMMWLN